MELGNWQRDVVKIVIYVAGVLMAVMAIKELVTVMFAAANYQFGFPFDWPIPSDEMPLQPYAVLQSTVQAVVGVLLATLSTTLSRWAFPDRPSARTPTE